MNFALGVGGGFLLAVLWMDLMFDVLVFRRSPGARANLPDEVLAEIAAYYRRVTTTAWPMNLLVSVVMAALVGILVVRLVTSAGTPLIDGVSLALCVFPDAVRLGAQRDPASEQTRLARGICHAHLVCLAAMTAFVALRAQV
jgi:hypothetical protein